MSVQPFLEENLTETEVKAFDETLFDGVANVSAIIVFLVVFHFFSHDRLT